jgi:hypothetical protein
MLRRFGFDARDLLRIVRSAWFRLVFASICELS